MFDFNFLKEKAKTKEIVLYGMGKLAEEAYGILLSYGIDIAFFIDKKFASVPDFLGKKVYSPGYVNPIEHFVIIIPLQYYKVMSQLLINQRMQENKDFCKWDSLCSQDLLYDGVEIGRHSHGFFAYADCLGISTKNYISRIGRFCSINKTAFMGADHKMGITTSHEVYRLAGIEYTNEDLQASVEIGNDVWIGANTFINASKVKHIGDGAIIAAGAVVVSDVPAYAVMCGVPAKVKKYRFSKEEIEILENTRWWEWSDERIKTEMNLFLNNELFFEKYGNKGLSF